MEKLDIQKWMKEFNDRKMNSLKQEIDGSDKLLVQKSVDGISWRYPNGCTKEIADRLYYELGIIIQMGFSDYFLVVQDFLDVGRRIGYMPEDRIDYLAQHCYEMSIQELNDYINEDQSAPGLTIGCGRGSAAGSLVAYLLGITSIDPFKFQLLFERFLNPERVSMPDIDSDLSKSEFKYGVRNIVIEYVKKKYGHNGVCGIATPSTLAAKAAVRNMARIMGSKASKAMLDDQKNNPKEKSIANYYLRLADVMAKMVPNQPKIKFSSEVLSDEGTETLDQSIRNGIVKYASREKGYEDPLFSRTQEEMISDMTEILDVAEQVEGCNINYGKHACGEIISDNRNVGAYAPMMNNAKYGLEIQMDAETAESRGFLKMDFLGLKTLNLITMIIRKIYKNYGTKTDVLNLPEDPKVYKKVFSAGKTNSVFQFESDGMKNMLTRFEPSSLGDLVLLVACFRPGPLQYLDGIIARKHGQHAEESAVTRIAAVNEDFKKLVEPTYFAIVYQEQVMQASQILAGYSLGHADVLRRAMGHKKADVLAAEEPSFIEGCVKNGISEKDARDLFSEMLDFAKYSFNKSHAAAYAVLGYITGWLKCNYPVEFYSSALNFASLKKYPALIAEAKYFGVEVHGPNINKSASEFTDDKKSVYFGFTGIKGIGKSLDSLDDKSTSFVDFIYNHDFTEGTLRPLIQVGAFDQFCSNRQALLDILPDYMKQKDIIRKRTAAIDIAKQMLRDLSAKIPLDREKYKIKTKSLPTQQKIQDRITAAEQSIRDAKSMMYSINIPVNQTYESMTDKLEAEKELLGVYISGHPLDPYGTPEEHHCEQIVSPKSGYMNLLGIVTNLIVRKAKNNGKEMAFFDLEDQTGTIHVCCFTKQYEMLKQNIAEGEAVIISGEKKAVEADNDIDDGSDEDGDDTDSAAPVKYEFYVNKSKTAIKKLKKRKETYRIDIDGVEALQETLDKLKYYIDQEGQRILLYNKMESRFEGYVPFCVSEKVFSSGFSLYKVNI